MAYFKNDNREKYSDLEEIISKKRRFSVTTNLTIRENCLNALSKGFPAQDVLYWAIRKECEPILPDLFLHYADKIDVNEPMFAKHATPLHMIAEKGWLEALNFIHLTNANFLIKDDEGLRPLDYAYRTFERLKGINLFYEKSDFPPFLTAKEITKDDLDKFQYCVINLLEYMTAEQEEAYKKAQNQTQPIQIQKAPSSVSRQTNSGSQRTRDS